MKLLLKNPVFLCLGCGYASYAFTLGGLAVWGITFIEKYYEIDSAIATYIFGGITVATGLVATILGSVL
jgi:hypothetical protein